MIAVRPYAAFVALGFAALTLIAGTPSAHAADAKLAVVRFEEAVRTSPQYKTADKKMTDEFSKRRNDLDTQVKSFEADVEKFKRDRATLSPDVQAKTEKDLGARQVDLNQANRKFQEDVAARQRELTNDVVGKVRDAIVAVAKEKSFDVVVSDPVYAATAFDITADVLRKLGGTGVAAPAAAPTGPTGK